MSGYDGIVTRPERPADMLAIRSVVSAAFPDSGEAGLVDALRLAARPFVSLVAELDGEVVGHIALTPVAFDPMSSRDRLALGLAPLSVAPAHQRHGVGTALVEAAVAESRELGADVVVVLGDPAYYARFGFEPASRLRLRCVYEAPEDAFQALVLKAFEVRPAMTTVLFRPEFDAFA
jgi:putative acetyltransferase